MHFELITGIVLLGAAICFVSCEEVGVGKVTIGTLGEEVSEVSVGELEIDTFLTVYLQVIYVNETTAAVVDLINNVTVTCDLNPGWSGYSQAIFEVVIAVAPNVSAPNLTTDPVVVRIPYSGVTAGRPTQLRCWGVTIIDGPSVGENDSVPRTQFTKEDSMSDPVRFVVRRKGTVNICESVVIVPNKEAVSQGSFLIELSETVRDDNVSVTCRSLSVNQSSPDGSIQLVFGQLLMRPGERKALVAYVVIDYNDGEPIYVSCAGQSIYIDGNDTKNGSQFEMDTSRGDKVIFFLDKGVVQIIPHSIKISTLRMELFLVLDAPVTSDVSFTCMAVTLNGTDEALLYADTSICKIVPYERPTPPALPPVDPGTVTQDDVETAGNGTLNSTIQMLDDNQTQTDPSLASLLGTSDLTSTTPDSMATAGTGSPPKTTSSPVNVTSEGIWSLDRSTYEFKVGGTSYDTLTLERASSPAESRSEMIMVRCCAPDTNQNPKYWGSSATSLVLASLSPKIPINWTIATPTDKAEEETPIPNPAYVEVAPCPCDLTKDACDANCCCDKTCSVQEKEAFDCIPGVEGGFPPPPPVYNCSSKPQLREDWFEFLCVHKENNAFLGYYYDPTDALRTAAEIDEKARANQPDHSYRETRKRSDTGEKLSTGYKSGVSVKVGLSSKTADNILSLDNQYRLALPQRTLVGKCSDTAPLQFLVDIDTDCVHTIAESLCSASSSLSTLVYAQSTSLSNPPCPHAPVILQAQGVAEVTEVNSNYLCADNAAEYVQSTTRASDLYTSTKKYLFTGDLPRDAAQDCDFDVRSGAYVCNVSETDVTRPMPPRCSWDDGYTRPPPPIYNETTKICHNAVVDVYYNFTWKGAGTINAGNVTFLNATLILADIPMEVEHVSNFSYTYVDAGSPYLKPVPTSPPVTSGTETVNPGTQTTEGTTGSPVNTQAPPEIMSERDNVNISVNVTMYPAVLTQRIKATFWHEYRLPNLTSDGSNDNTTAGTGSFQRVDRYQRSGKPGYFFDLPVISGVAVTNSSDFMYVDTNATWRTSVWEADTGGLCQGAGRSVVQFGVGASSSCMLRLGLTELHDDCDYLRKLILHHQDALMPSTHMSRNGDPLQTELGQWIRVIRENISHIVSLNESGSTTNQTTDPAATSDPATDVTTEVSNTTLPEQPDDVITETIGKCPNIPNGIHVDVMYAQVGAVNARPVFEIVGAKISYTLSTWQLTCSAASGVSCLSRDSQTEEVVQTFILSSTVDFIEVPPTEPPPKTRRAMELGQDGVCKRDACWEELFYPMMRAFRGDQSLYTLTATLSGVMFIIALFMISRPWW